MKTFTSFYAVTLFKQHTGINFHPTVPGQLLAHRRVAKCGKDDGKALYDVQYWDQLWLDMMSLAQKRARYAQNASPIDCAPPLPDFKVGLQDESFRENSVGELKQFEVKTYSLKSKHINYSSSSARANGEANFRFNHAISRGG